MSSPLYDRIGHVYTRTRRADARIADTIWRGLGDARTIINVGAGAGSYEPPGAGWSPSVQPKQVASGSQRTTSQKSPNSITHAARHSPTLLTRFARAAYYPYPFPTIAPTDFLRPIGDGPRRTSIPLHARASLRSFSSTPLSSHAASNVSEAIWTPGCGMNGLAICVKQMPWAWGTVL